MNKTLGMIVLLVALFVAAWQLADAEVGDATPTTLPDLNAPINPASPMVPGVVLVGLKPNATMSRSASGVQSNNATLNSRLTRLGARSVEPLFPFVRRPRAVPAVGRDVDLARIYRLRFAPNADVLRAIQELQADPSVAYAEPDYQAHLINTPNDPNFLQQWGLTKINAPAAWDETTGSSSVVIAVVDSGLDVTHSDLSSKLWTNRGEIPGNGIDDDNDGFVDDIKGWNLLNNNADLSDTTGHGTEVAGVMAAATNNSTGIAGMCWQCQLMVVKVASSGGVANYSDIAAGVAYAAQKGAKVINISLGGNSDSITLKTAIATAAQTAVIVGGAGNDNSSALFYPAAYDDYVLAVAGTTQTDTKVGTSNYGTWVDVSAPGEAIYTTFSGGGYGSSSGTSLAAPFASGLAGLLWTRNPGWSANQVRAQIIQTTDNIDSVNPDLAGKLGSGRINAQKALTTNPASLIRYVSYAASGVPNGTLKVGSTVVVTVTLRSDWKNASSVAATLSTTSSDVSITKASADYGAIPSGETVANNSDVFQVNVPAGKYGLAIPFTLSGVADGVAFTQSFTATTESTTVNVAGTISSDTTWTNDRIYNVTGNVIVGTGVTLTIQPGTVIKFNKGRAMGVLGTLIADGTATQNIRFTSTEANPKPADWGNVINNENGGIIFVPTSQAAQFDANGNYIGGSIIRYSVVEYSMGIVFSNAAPFVDHNLIWQNYPYGVDREYESTPGSQFFLTHNRILSNPSEGIILHSSIASNIIRENLIANSPIYIVGGETTQLISNTITGNVNPGCAFSAICIANTYDKSVQIVGNNLFSNQTDFDMALLVNVTQPVTGTNNYWGTTSSAVIASRINDLYGLFRYNPFRTNPEPTAPPFLYQFSTTPASPVGIQRVAFNLNFSAPMDQSINPAVTFGATFPYTSYVVLNNAQWFDNTHWRAEYDITSLVPRDTYTLSVSSAVGTDGMQIPDDTRFAFTVNYAGTITDQTPPNPPAVFATGVPGNASAMSANWSASGASPVTSYRYAIGSAAGATDIVNWTETSEKSVWRTSLGLVSGQQYWIAVQATNAGGLWSNTTYRSFVAGQQSQSGLYLPLITR